MNIKVSKIEYDNFSINHTLNIMGTIEFGHKFEAPICLSGKLKTNDGKIISLLDEFHLKKENNIKVYFVSDEEKAKHYNENKRGTYEFQLKTELSQKAIDYIEDQRLKDPDKSVKFAIDFITKFIEIKGVDYKLNNIEINYKMGSCEFKIEQNDWINNFSPKLGLGKFIILELNIPNNNVPEYWKQLYESLFYKTVEMENCIKIGDWQKTMFLSRQFFEDIKFGDNKPGHRTFKDEFTILMSDENHTEEGIQNLYDSIYKLFGFASKYVHTKDREGNIMNLPNSCKEDAYLVYCISMGLLNLIGSKLSRKLNS